MRLSSFGATLLFVLASAADAQVIAYDVPPQAGNQAFPGNLGLDFDVNVPITITRLGAFDANGDGFVNTVQVQIFNRDTAAAVGPAAPFNSTSGTLINGSRFLSLTPFVLPAGHYSVVAVGFGLTDLNGNSIIGAPFTASTENTGGGAISFVGSGRYDANVTLDFPALVVAGPSNIFLAGTFEFVVGSTAPGKFSQPSGIAIGSTGFMYITDTGNNRVEVFDSFGNFRFKFGTAGAGPGQFNGPAGIAVNASYIYVCDTGNNRVAVFDINGNYRYQIGSAGTTPGKFTGPSDVSIAPNGFLVVVDKGNNRVEVFDANGNFRSQFGL